MSLVPSYSEERIASIAIKPTPSYIYNNLSYNGSHFAYCHKNEVYLVADPSVNSTPTPPIKANLKESGQVYQAKWVSGSKGFISEGGKNMLVVASSNNVQVLDAEASKLFFTFSIPSAGDAMHRTKFSRGITTANATGSRSFLLVGTSSGSILAFESKRDKDLAFAQVIKAHGFPITELATDISNPTVWASGDHNGVLVVWNGLDKEISFPSSGGFPCTSLAIRSALLIATFGNGVITIYNLKSKTKCVEIEAHTRCINAIDIHPFKDIFVTISDDCSVNVWALNTDITEVTHIFNGKIKDSLLCGVQFSGENYSSIAVSAYDSLNLSVFTG